MALSALFLISYSCSPEGDSSDFGDGPELNAVNAKSDNAKKVKRSWKIKGSGTFAPDFASAGDCSGLLPLKIEGTGIGSHIGRYDVLITWCTGGIGGPDNFITGTITVANGDLINFKSVAFRPFEVDYIVTGGSGRFEEAGGEFTLIQTEFEILSPEGAPPSGTYANEGGGYIIY
mgnify:CR=1 FL=1